MTANVFGILRRMRPSLWLRPLLNQAFKTKRFSSPSMRDLSVRFWQPVPPPSVRANIEGNSEIDVQLCFADVVVFLEAKYRSGLSQRTTMDAHRNQLVRLLDVVYEYSIATDFHPRQPYVLLLGVAREEPALLTAYRDPKQLLMDLKHHSRFPDYQRMATLLSRRVGYASWSGLGDILSEAVQQAKRMEQGLLQDMVMYIRHKVSTASLPGGSALQLGFPELETSDGTCAADPPRLSMTSVTTTSRQHGR